MGELLNLIGLSAGVALYTMLLAMVVRPGRTRGVSARRDPLLLATAILGLIWNLCALPAYELTKFGIQGPLPFFIALGFSALGFLPAVVVHSVLRDERDEIAGGMKRTIAVAAYTASAGASVLHFTQVLSNQPVPSAVAMRLLTYTFIVLIVPLAAATRRQPGSRRALWAAALATFAVSALHLSQLHQGNASWPVELLGHHASVPLAVAILYQDYPFAFADLFLKRALTLLTLVAIAFLGIVLIGLRFPRETAVDPRQVGLLVTLSVATALVYPLVRARLSWFVDTIVLRRPDYPSLRATIARRALAHSDVPRLLDDVCELLTPALSARSIRWRELKPGRSDETPGSLVFSGEEATALVESLTGRDETGDAMTSRSSDSLAAAVLVPTSEVPQYVMSIGALTAGRRLLSYDLATLESIGVLVARRVDAIRITAERYEREIREQEIGKLASEAELRALRAQVNPHFLFNALTTIGYLIQNAPPLALDTLMRLTALLRAVLRSDGEFTTLGRELEVVEAYLDIEHARFEDRLRVSIDVPARLHQLQVPTLVLQPIVENAIKHGIAPQRSGGEVRISAALDSQQEESGRLVLRVSDTGVGASAETLERGRAIGVGLRNVERRLECQYGDGARLTIRSDPGLGTRVQITLPATVLSTTNEGQMARAES